MKPSLVSRLNDLFKRFRKPDRQTLYTAIEIAILVVFTWFVVRPFLDMDPNMVPNGREYLWSIESHYTWERVKECGSCAFWNGSLQGGYPTFANPLNSFLHPLVVFATLGWGVLNGSKLALAGAFLLAALGQWLLGWVLETGRVARVWAAMMVVVGGHMAARMDLGTFGLIISTASFSLVLPLFFYLIKRPTQRAAVLFGISLAILAVGGQGYIQAGTALVLILALAVYQIFWAADFPKFFKLFLLSLLLAVLLAGPFVIPSLHFLPNFHKDYDPAFATAQPFSYVPLNLFIKDLEFYKTPFLSKAPFPAHYILYIGWMPVLLAVLSLVKSAARKLSKRVYLLLAITVSAFWIASAEPLKYLIKIIPFDRVDQLIAGFRYPAFIASLAVPPLLGLAALGLDWLLKAPWPTFSFGLTSTENRKMDLAISLKWVVLIFLYLAVKDPYEFNKVWLISNELPAIVEPVLDELETPDAQWVSTPLGQHFWIQPALERGMKLALDTGRTWEWYGLAAPTPKLEAATFAEHPTMAYLTSVDGITIHEAESGGEYAIVEHFGDDPTVCSAQSSGGNIDVDCTLSQAGTLVVQEYNWSGWKATVNGQRASLEESQWLSVQVPAGDFSVQFRYRPWDVPLGIFLSVIGMASCVYIWVRSPQNDESPAKIEATSPPEDDFPGD